MPRCWSRHHHYPYEYIIWRYAAHRLGNKHPCFLLKEVGKLTPLITSPRFTKPLLVANMAWMFRLWWGACIAFCALGQHVQVLPVDIEDVRNHHHHHRHLQQEQGRGCATPDPTEGEVQSAMEIQEVYIPALPDLQQQQQPSSKEENSSSSSSSSSWNWSGQTKLWWQEILRFFLTDKNDSDSDEDVPVPSPASILAPGPGPGPQPHPPPFSAIVPTYYHVIETSNVADVYIPGDDAILAQHIFLNQAFANAKFNFSLSGITRTTNESWYTAILWTAEEREMKEVLRMGGPETLNVYLNSPNGDNSTILGWSTYPSWYADDPRHDGVVCRASTVPGGPRVNYDLGYTVIHEVGHWLGLFHPFQFGCTEPGDGIDDTPYMTVNKGCPSTKPDTCPDKPGLDPIENFMSYSYDRCMTEFTSGQSARMQSQWNTYRASVV